MAYTKIPQTNIAGTIGAPIGKVTGIIISTGTKSLDVLERLLWTAQEENTLIRKQVYAIQSEAALRAAELERIATLKTNAVLSNAATTAYEAFLNKISPGTKARVEVDISRGVAALHKEAQQLLDNTANQVRELLQRSARNSNMVITTVDTTLGVVENSLNVVLRTASTLKSVIATLRAPLAALRAAILVIKAIPLPQRYLVVSFTILESDLLEMMEQIIAQAEEEVRAIEAILSMIEGSLAPIRDRIKRIRATLNLMKMNNLMLKASPDDVDILDKAGLFDKESGQSIFDVIEDGQRFGSGWESYGQISGDLTDPYIGNQIQALKPGEFVHTLTSASGSYVEEYYKWQVEKPPYPKGHPEAEGWSRYPDRPSRLQDEEEKLWVLSQLQNEGQPYGNGTDEDIREVLRKDWDELFKTIDYFKSIQRSDDQDENSINYDPLTGYRQKSNILLLDESNFDKKPGILKPSSWDNLEDAALGKLRDLPLSLEFQNYLESLWQADAAEKAGTSTLVDDAVAYRAANGELYYLRVVEDSHSPKVAVRRYVQAKDESGVVVLEGIKTFSLNKSSLIEEMKIQLDQLTR